MDKKIFFSAIITIIISVFVVVGVIFAWTEPTATPPGGNVPAPLNVSNVGQVKAGGLTLNTSGAVNGLIVRLGRVGIGLTNPAKELDVVGEIHATGDICTDQGGGVCLGDLSGGGGGGTVGGSGTASYIPVWATNTTLGNSPIRVNTSLQRINFANYKLEAVEEIDPVFKIEDKKYTTYLPDMVGQKLEVVGESQLKGNEIIIDLYSEPEGSDLWIFWKTAGHDTIIPFVSSQDNSILYAYLDGSKFIVRLASGEENAEFSYRLIGTRLDHVDDSDNLYDDQSTEYYIDIDHLRELMK